MNALSTIHRESKVRNNIRVEIGKIENRMKWKYDFRTPEITIHLPSKDRMSVWWDLAFHNRPDDLLQLLWCF